MWPRRILIFLIGLAAGLFDACVSSWLPGAWGAMRFSLPLVILLAAFSTQERALTAAVASGIVLDILLPSFGLVTFRFVVIAFVMHLIAEHYLTNRSVPGSLGLGFAGLLADRLMVIIITFTRHFIGTPFVLEVHPSFWAEAIWMMTVMTAAFLFFAAFSKRFMPLITRR